MNIALVSFEYPPETAYGGIATYMAEIARMLSDANHRVEVFCAGEAAKKVSVSENLIVHTVADMDKDRFAESLMPVFTSRHRTTGFDVVESAEIYGDSRKIRTEFPEIPLVVKVHTPSFLCHRLNHLPLTLGQKFRFSLGALRRGKVRWLSEDLSVLKQRNIAESSLYHDADVVVSPSRDLIRLIEEEWGIRADGIRLLPNPHAPSPDLLHMHANDLRPSLLYLGRLEMRKGITDLIEALALLESERCPIPTRFVGAPFPSPKKKILMDKWAASRLPMKTGRYTFTGKLARPAALSELSDCGLVALPSRWENFPYTCLEAMSAGRVVIGSSAGGMADMIENGKTGYLVPPREPKVLASKIKEILANSEQLAYIGNNARDHVLKNYSHAAILPQQIAAYESAIHFNRRTVARS